MKIRRNPGASGRVRVRKDLLRSSKLWQSALLLPMLLFLLSLLQLKHLPVCMLVTSLGAISAIIIISLPAHAERSFAKTVARRVISREVAEHQPNRPVKLLEHVSVRSALVAAKLGIIRETAPKQQQLATLEES